MKRFLPPVLMALILPLLLGMSKKQSLLITFHTMAAPSDSPKTVFPFDLNGKRIYFKLVPEFTQDNFSGYLNFPAENGNSNGITVQLDAHGKYTLELLTRSRKDEYLLALVNAKPVDFVVMDEPVLDGRLTVWQGISNENVKELGKKVPRLRKTGPPTMSKDIDMLPTTRKEKEHYLEGLKDQDKAEAARAKKGKGPEPDVPSLNLPPPGSSTNEPPLPSSNKP